MHSLPSALSLRTLQFTIAGLVLAVVLSACGTEASGPTERLVGTDQVAYPIVERASTYPSLPIVLAGTDGRGYLVDSGTPWTLIVTEGSDFNFGLMSAQEWSETTGFSAGTLAVARGPLEPFMADLATSVEMAGLPFGGVLGANYMLATGIKVESSGDSVIAGSKAPDQGDPTALAVDLRASGAAQTCFRPDEHCFAYDGDRLLVDLEVDGVEMVGLIDLGAPDVHLTPEGWAKLQSETDVFERDNVAFIDAAPGDVDVMLFVADRVSVGEAVAGNVVIGTRLADDGAEHPLTRRLDRFEDENGFRVDALVGRSFLDNFDLYFGTDNLIDFASPSNGPRVLSEPTVGIGFGAPVVDSQGCWRVQLVLAGSEAAERLGVKHGDCILSVAGVEPTDMTWDALVASLGTRVETLSDGRIGWPVQMLGPDGVVEVEFPREIFLDFG